MFVGYRHCKRCGKPLMGLFDGALCDECEEAEQESTDAISREDAMASISATIVDYMPYLVQDGRTAKIPLELTKAIMRVPPVMKKSGKWIIKEDNTSYVKTISRRWAECSCCKWSMSPGYVDRYAFCPNCGAKMFESQKSVEV